MLHELTLSGLTSKLASKEVSSREAMQACLDRIAAVDGQVNAFMSIDRDDALGFAAPSLLSVDLDGCPLSTEIKEEQMHRDYDRSAYATAEELQLYDLLTARLNARAVEAMRLEMEGGEDERVREASGQKRGRDAEGKSSV